ncbi:phage tail length tape measure family protein [Brevundimonas sp. Root1279]|uniref:phage tail length tape measure family protein n=1 Tax=Brevundimonas sp. Root1279 TaxID=1736443 RepID=UPI0006F52475|nr:phage tail length tape measure family protein [Brevundimonas sp. Root1279]KQW79712.1 hypothetical protein ASC65_14280 [Brevundimonas sp. Root1279]
MADLAELGIRVRSEDAVVASDNLDDLTASAVRAETATESLGASSQTAGAQVSTMAVAVRQQNAVLAASRSSMGLTTAEGLNMSRQMADIGVQMAMGMSPFMIAIQQGPQLFDIFQGAAIRAGTTIRAAMVATGIAVWTALAPLIPIIAGIALAAAGVTAAFAIFSREASKAVGDVTDELNLTEAQLKRLEEQGVTTTATMGDVFRAYGTTVKETIQSTIGPQLEWLQEKFGQAYDWTVKNGIAAAKAITGAFWGSFYAIRAVWSDLPAVIGDLAITAANRVINAVEDMVNGTRDQIQNLIDGYNMFAALTGKPVVPIALPRADFGDIENQWAGAARSAGARAGAAFSEGFAAADEQMDASWNRFLGNLGATTRARVLDAAGDPGAERAGSAGRAARQVQERLTKIEDINLEKPRGAFIELTSLLELTAQELRLVDELALDTADGLSSAFGETGRALGDLLTVMTGYEARIADINRAEEQLAITRDQADRHRAQAQIQNYGDMAAAARGFFKEGSDGYEIMLAVERVYRAQQLIGMIQEMTFGKQATAESIANSIAKGTASMAAGAARMFEALGPWAFPAVAAMLGLLAGLGLSNSGGSSSAPAAANDNTSPDTATAAVRGFNARDAVSRDAAAASIASQVDVRVSADRDGLNAFVTGKAVQVATPLATAAGGAAYNGARQTVPADLAKNRRYTR